MSKIGDIWCDVLDRLEKLANLPLPELRRQARGFNEEDPASIWERKSRGECIAFILEEEFGQEFSS
jgi:hypothetical protein